MESLDQSDCIECPGPDGHSRINKESSGQASKTVADKIRTKRIEELIPTTKGETLVEEYGESLSWHNIIGVGGAERYTAHNGNEHVFLLIEGSGVQAVLFAEQFEAPIWKHLCEEFTHGVFISVSIEVRCRIIFTHRRPTAQRWN